MRACERGLEDRSKQVSGSLRRFQAASYYVSCSKVEGEVERRECKNAQMHSANQPSLNSARIPTPEPPIID